MKRALILCVSVAADAARASLGADDAPLSGETPVGTDDILEEE